MKLAVYGLGKLGLPLASVLTLDGYEVLAYDKDEDRVKWCIEQQSLERSSGSNIIDEPDVSVAAGNLNFITVPQEADVNYIVVPTPSKEDGAFDSFYVEECLRQIVAVNHDPTIAVITSTVFPGTCERLHNEYGHRLRIVYNPTFIALGSVVRNLTKPDMLLYGVDQEDDITLVNDIWETVVAASSPALIVMRPHTHIGPFVEAELLKLSINCVLATKISLANSLGKLFSAYGVPASMVAEIGADSRIGTAYMVPGSPISGPCLPRDNKALQLAAHKNHVKLPISEATEDVDYELRTDLYKSVLGELVHETDSMSVGIMGMTYKYGVAVTEGSIGSWLLYRLKQDGVMAYGYDQYGPSDDLDDILSCSVVVVCHRELARLAEHAKGEVIHVWS